MAYKNGLNEADQLISVNGVDFRTISHNEAVRLFKEFNEFLIVAKYSPHGMFQAIFQVFLQLKNYHLDYKKFAPLNEN